jgi:hypothetical protein
MPAELVVVYCLKLIGFYVRKDCYYKNCEGFPLLIMWGKRRVLHTSVQAKSLADWEANRLSGYRSKTLGPLKESIHICLKRHGSLSPCALIVHIKFSKVLIEFWHEENRIESYL